MSENNLEMYSSDNEESLDLIRLKNKLDDLMRQQEKLVDNFDMQGVDITSSKAREVLDPISEQIALINEQIEKVDSRQVVEEVA